MRPLREDHIVLPVQEGRNSRDGNYSFEFCPLHAVRV